MALAATLISLTSLAGTTAVFSFTRDALADTTVFYLIDPATGLVLLTFSGQNPPNATLVGLNPQQAYDVIAVSFKTSVPLDQSPPSLAVPIRPAAWNTFKTVVVCDPWRGAREYALVDNVSNAILAGPHPYHWFVDSTVYADELLAQQASYRIDAYAGQATPFNPKIVECYRSDKSLCLITGDANFLNSNHDWTRKLVFTVRPFAVQPEIQRAHSIEFEQYAYPNYLGKWGLYLMSGAQVRFTFQYHKVLDFVVPFAATAELIDLPVVRRTLLPKNT